MHVTEKPYQQVERLAASLRQDGRSDWAEILLRAHEGIFNGTELYFVWITHVEDLLRKKHLTQSTRRQAEALLERLGKDFAPQPPGKIDAGEFEAIRLVRDSDENIFPDDPKH